MYGQLLGVDLLLSGVDDATISAPAEKTNVFDSSNNSEPSAAGRATFDGGHGHSLNETPSHSTASDLTSESELKSNFSIRRSITLSIFSQKTN